MEQPLGYTRQDDTLVFTGELDSESIPVFWPQRQQLMAGVRIVDLSGLTRVDTAGLALLIRMVAQNNQQPAKITLRGASENLRTLVTLYNLPDGLLPAFEP